MARTRKNTVDPSTISFDWAAIDLALNSGERVSLSHLAQAHKVFPIDLRRLFEARYGDDIVFKRGRTGGVYRKTAAGAAVKTPTVASTPAVAAASAA